MKKRTLAVTSMLMLLGTSASSQEMEGAKESLAQKLTNPIADLVSIPFQFNWQSGVGPEDEMRLVLNIQPVVPISLSDNWNLVGRFIVPIVSQPTLVAGGTPRTGLSDGLLSLFLSPVREGKFQWGVGPVGSLPLTTDPLLGSGQWSAGPTAVALYMTEGWTFALLGNHLWSIAETGDTDRAFVNRSFIQPVASYTTKSAWTFTAQSEATIDWEADDGEELTLPINAFVSKLLKLGPLPMSVQIGGGIYAVSPTGGPEWQSRLAFTVLLPTARPRPAANAAENK